MSTGVEPTSTLTEEDDWWVARDTGTGVTSQGRTRHEALDNLNEALAGYHGEGDEPTEEDPETSTSTPTPTTSVRRTTLPSNDGERVGVDGTQDVLRQGHRERRYL